MSTQQAAGNNTAIDSTKLRWGWIVLGAVILEILLILLFVPMMQYVEIQKIAPYAGIGTFVFGFLVSWWVVGRIPGRRVLHGFLIGVLATLIYFGMCMTSPGGLASVVAMYGPVLFYVGNGVRIVGSTAGAYFRSR